MGPTKGIIDVLDDSTAPVPHRLYKYAHIEDDKRTRYAREVFEENRLYFPSPDGLNDPFDSVMTWVDNGSLDEWRCFYREEGLRLCKTEEEQAKHLRYEEEFLRLPEYRHEFVEGLKADFMAKRGEFGVFCMSRRKKSILMWAHWGAPRKRCQLK